MRADLYTLIHKAQRFHLFNLSNDIGTADFGDEAATDEIGRRVLEMLEHLRDHAQNEETYIHPLFEKLGSTAGALEVAHHSLEDSIRGLETIIQEERFDELYSRYTLFLGQYLLHLDDEENAQTNVLWPNYSDRELLEVFNRFKAERSQAAAKADLELMLPALSVAELARMFQGIKATAPVAAFEGVCTLAGGILEPQRWAHVRKAANLTDSKSAGAATA